MERINKIRLRCKQIFFYYRQKSKVRLLRNSSFDIRCTIGGGNSLGENTHLSNCIIGYGTYIGANNRFSNVKIGRYCSIASNVNIVVGKHPTHTFVSTHPAFFSNSKRSAGFTYSNKQKYVDQEKTRDGFYVEIGNDVWIGDGVSIFGGVKIGDGAIIGANTMVIHDIEPYSINVGIPSRVIKKRFTEEQISFLLKYQWWNKSEQWIMDNIELFENIDKFIIKVDK